MRTKFLLSAVALTATFAACNNDDVPSSVNNNLPISEEVVGSTLVSEGGAISFGDIESRVTATGWETSDRLALAWYNIDAAGIAEKQEKIDWDGLGTDKNIYANHLFTRTAEGKFVTNSNIYEGAHFIYFPYAYKKQVGEMTVDVNAETQESDFTIDNLNKALYISAQDFITEDDVDAETGKLEKSFYIHPAVNALKVNATPEAGISSNAFLKNLEISKLYIWNQDALFNPTATIDPNKVPMVEFDEYGQVDTDETYETLKETLADAFTATAASGLTTNIDADLTLANVNALRAFTLPTVAPSTDPSWTEIHVFVKANGETEGTSYDMGKFVIKVPSSGELKDNVKNHKALARLQSALYDDTKDFYLHENINPAGKVKPLGIDIDLLAAEFEPDFNISNLEEWNLTVALVDALNAVKEINTKYTFNLTGAVCVTEGKTINVPVHGLNVTTTATGAKVCFETDYTVNAALANVFTTDDIVEVVTGSTLKIEDNVVLKADLHNDGIINVGYKAQLGDTTTPNVDNEHGRINVVYGSYVNVEASKFGTIAYEVAANEYAYRINNLLATTGNALGHARVNTLVVNKDITFNVAKADGDTPQQDPYEDDSQIGETINNTLLAATDIELNGGTLCANIDKKQVKNVKALATETVSTIKDINIVNDLTVLRGASVTFDATANTLGQKATASIGNAIKNEGILNVAVSIKTKDVFNEKKGQSILSVLGKEVVWYIDNYYQGGMAQGDILKLVGTYSSLTASKNMTASETISGTYDGLGNALSLNTKPSFNGLATGSGNITVTNLTIDGKNYLTTIADANGYKGFKATRALYFTDAENILINNVKAVNAGYYMNILGKAATKETNKLTITNSILKGWGSTNENFASVTIRNTEFGFNTYFDGGKENAQNGAFRPYSKTVIEDCTFEEGFYLVIDKLNSVATLTLKNCKVGETVITKSNYKTLLNIDGDASQLVYVTIE